ncbi:MAG: nuclear transport factor 2 family protein [Candidatus Korobacteraceae bacterium]
MNLVRFALPVITFVLIPLSCYAQPAIGAYPRLALWCGVASLSAAAAGQSPGPDTKTADAEIRQLLDTQVAAWNRGDLEGYMSGYLDSEELTFFFGATETRGWRPTLESYRQYYKKTGNQMGHLDFSNIHIETLGEDAALVRGRWRLKTSSGPSRTGPFTLVLRRFPGGWRIVHDHSS